MTITCTRNGVVVLECLDGKLVPTDLLDATSLPNLSMPALSGPTAIFRLSMGHDLVLTVSLHQSADSPLAADIAFRFLQRLSAATAERLERLMADRGGEGPDDDEMPPGSGSGPPGERARPVGEPHAATAAAHAGAEDPGVMALVGSSAWRALAEWFRAMFGTRRRPVGSRASLGK
jgi:UDP-GlcNAc:undecaprenyl-phosphate GlcNAc-1-phosphate transferase